MGASSSRARPTARWPAALDRPPRERASRIGGACRGRRRRSRVVAMATSRPRAAGGLRSPRRPAEWKGASTPSPQHCSKQRGPCTPNLARAVLERCQTSTHGFRSLEGPPREGHVRSGDGRSLGWLAILGECRGTGFFFASLTVRSGRPFSRASRASSTPWETPSRWSRKARPGAWSRSGLPIRPLWRRSSASAPKPTPRSRPGQRTCSIPGARKPSAAVRTVNAVPERARTSRAAARRPSLKGGVESGKARNRR